jgi:hypothetical protein
LTALKTVTTRPASPNGATIVVKKLDTPTTVNGQIWAEVQVQLNERNASVIGIVRAGVLSKGGDQ